MKSPDTHVVLVRPVATNKWKPLAYAKSANDAIKIAEKPRRKMRHGDLILAIDIAEVSAIQERGKYLYFVNQDGIATKAPRTPKASTWFLLWESPDASANEMLLLCARMDRKILATTACAIVRAALPYVTGGEDRPRALLETVEAWVRGEVTARQVENASDLLVYVANNTADSAAADAAFSVAKAASVIFLSRFNAAYAAHHAASAMPGIYEDNIRQLAHIVREYIPLHVVLESRV